MKAHIYLLLVVMALTSCLSKQEVLRNPSVMGRNVPVPPLNKPAKANTSLSGYEYIDRYKTIAIDEMNKYGIPASIKLAQALLESGNGNSMLARDANNHFGIKCTAEWPGRRAYKDDDRKDDCFRVYDRPEDSFRDHSQFLLRNRYAALFELNKNDYKGWAKGLKSAGYATNPRYADLLISLIERYGLHQYDVPETPIAKVKREEIVEAEVKENIPEKRELAKAKVPVAIEIHEVRSGDTLSSLARKYGMSPSELMDLNGLATESLFVGQLILISL